MSVEIVDGSFLKRFERLLGVRRPTVWLASPFLTKAMAEWLAALPACKHGDRRLLVSWATRSIDTLYLSAHGVDILRESGFVVRDLPRLHAKTVIAGDQAYFGSGNLTFRGLDAGNTEIGVFANGSPAATARKLFDAWWTRAQPLSVETISAAKDRQDELAKTRGWDIDRERQPGHQPPPNSVLPGHGPPQAWIKSQYYRHNGWTIAPGEEHWIGDPGIRDKHGARKYRKDKTAAGEPKYKVGDLIGVYFGGTQRVPLVVEVIADPKFAPEFMQKNNDGGESDAGERWPWMTRVRGKLEVPLDDAPDIDYLGIRGPIEHGQSHFKISPEQYQKLLAAFPSK